MKGIRGPGQMGNKRITQKGLTIVEVRSADNLIMVRGAVPGPRNGVVEVRTDG
jgi:large subunit ribosomal protein L3